MTEADILELSGYLHSMHNIPWTDPPPPTPTHLLTADSAQQSMGAILFGNARGHIRVFIAGDHRYYPNVVK